MLLRYGCSMKVKIGDKFHDSEEEPIMLFMDNDEKVQIANMGVEATKYCSYPESMSEVAVVTFMGSEVLSLQDEYEKGIKQLMKENTIVKDIPGPSKPMRPFAVPKVVCYNNLKNVTPKPEGS